MIQILQLKFVNLKKGLFVFECGEPHISNV